MLYDSRKFELWSELHAVVVLTAFVAALVAGHPGLLIGCALVSFGTLCLRARGAWTRSGRFGLANTVTALRLALTCGLGSALDAPGRLLAIVGLAVFALDALDGLIARRTRSDSSFGALFDMESDAFFVLVLGVVLYERGTAGIWIVSSGVLRYAYVLCLALLPARREELPRSRFGRVAFGALVVGLLSALLVPGTLTTVLALAGTALVCSSFARGFVHSFGPRPLAG